MSSDLRLPFVLLVLVVVSGVGTAYVKHMSRIRFVELQQLQLDHDELRIEWGRLQLEISTWAAHDRVRTAAAEQLDLFMPPGDSVVVVRVQ